MKSQTVFRRVRTIVMLCAGFFLMPSAPAQTATGVNGRYLLIFDTSSAMKKRVESTQYAVEQLFFTMMNGQLQPGDTIGVWSFNRKLRAGDFPLLHWFPQNAAKIASSITNFAARQHYSRNTRFEAMMPDVNKLVRSSERLTVLIFCDGRDEIKGTPFDDAINGIFKRNEPALRKADQTFIIVLRSQFGKYTGYSVNSSALGVSLPEFPPLPAPPSSATSPKTNPPPRPSPVEIKTNRAPVVQLPPLVIVGTNVGTNLIPSTPQRPEPTNQSPARLETNIPPPVITLTNSTNAVPPPPAKAKTAFPPPAAKTQTNAPVPPDSNRPGLSRTSAMVIGASLLAAAVGLTLFALVRSRRPKQESLISRAMKKK